MATAANLIPVIEQTHSWGDCMKHDSDTVGRHCHCSIEVAAAKAGEVRTCRHCLVTTA